MKKKQLKRMVGLTTALSLTANTFTQAAVGIGNQSSSEVETLYSNQAEGFADKYATKPSESSTKSRLSDGIDTSSNEYISVIVEFVSEPLAKSGVATYDAKSSKVVRDHEVFEQFLSNLPTTYGTGTIEVGNSFSVVYNGVALKIKASEVEKLLDCSVVERIHLDEQVSISTDNETTVTTEDEKDSSVNDSQVNEEETETDQTDKTVTDKEEETVEADEVESDVEEETTDESGEVTEVVDTETTEEETSDTAVIYEVDQSSVIEPYMMDSVPFLNIDDLHNEDINGSGIKVGVLDTGIDYNHPDLTDAYKGFRSESGDANNQDINFIKGWDFVDNDADPMETTYNDWLASGQEEYYGSSAYYTSHGTHVSGTVAGQQANDETDYSVLGVAPGVELYSYRVLGPYGSGSTSGIIAGIEKSVTDGMDVINLSLGANSNNPFDPLVDAVNNATLAGVVTVVANGNAGPEAGTVGTPATAQLPIAVGASTVDLDYDLYNVALGDLEVPTEQMAKNLGQSIEQLLNQDLELVYCGLGNPEDFEGKDVAGKVAVIDRGSIALVNKIYAATEAGAALVIMVNNVDTGSIPYLGELQGVNTLAMSLQNGETLKKLMEQETQSISLSFKGSYTSEGDTLTDFSSAGPVGITSEIRPDVVAPGSQVFSTVPEYINNPSDDEDYSIAYQRMSGTSMATPHVTGIAALILQANPNYTPQDVKAALMNTAEVITQEDGSEYSVHQIGAGRVNPYEAVKETVSFKAVYDVVTGSNYDVLENETSMLSFARVYKTEEPTATKVIPVTVSNDSTSSKTYKITVQHSTSSRATNASENGVKVNVINEIIVPAGDSRTFDVEVSIPNDAAYGNYEGYINFVEVGNESNDYQMPFSATFLKEGIVSLDYPEISNGYGKGLTAFNTSALLNKHGVTYFTGVDIAFAITLSEPVNTIETYVKDADGNVVGYGGSMDASWISEGTASLVTDLVKGGHVYKIVDGKVSHEQVPLSAGIYTLEVIANSQSGKEFKDSLPIAIINDTASDKVSFSLNNQTIEPGIIEVTEDLYRSEYWYDDALHEGIWVEANVYNDYVQQLKVNYGLEYLEQSQLNSIIAFAKYPNGYLSQIGTMPKDNGNVLVAGIEKEDFSNGYFHLQLDYVNAATITDKPNHFVFVTPETAYLSIDSA